MRHISSQLPSPPGRCTILIATAAVLILLSSCRRVEEEHAEDIRPVRTIRIEQRSATNTTILSGTVQAQTEINLSFRIDGHLIERRINVGDEVRVGQVIATLDPHNEEIALQASRARVDAALAQQVEAHNNYTRMGNLVGQRAVAVVEFEKAEALSKVADTAVDTAR